MSGGLVRSPVTLDDIRKDVLKYAGSTTPKFENALVYKVIKDAYYAFKLPRREHPVHLNDVPLLHLDNWSASPGLPWKQYGYNSKREVANDRHAFQSIRRVWHLVKEGKSISLPDCAAFVRPHLVSKGEKKVRAVWGYPATIAFQEAAFAIPLIEAYKKHKNPIAYGYETAKGGCRKLFHELGKYNNFLSSDYKNFDKTVPAWLIRIAFDILLANLDLTAYRHRGVPDTSKLYRAWKKVIDYFINTPIRLCNGERYRKNKGIASGSYFTQLVGSIVNWIVTRYCVLVQKLRVVRQIVLGDDSLTVTNHPVDIDRFVRDASRFGLVINASKTQQTSSITEIKFLGYIINQGGPSRPKTELFAALLYPERSDRDFNDYASRALGLMIANFGHHLDFDQCCREITQIPFKVTYSPSMSRYLKILGIDSLPKEPPDLF